MRVVLESELNKLARENVEEAKRVLHEVDFVFDRGGWFVSPEYYLDKLERRSTP